jgi:hypothetical protein
MVNDNFGVCGDLFDAGKKVHKKSAIDRLFA